MKPAISKQAVLKASLLMALAANLSWEPFTAFQAYDAASGSESASPTPRAATRAEESARVTPPAAPRVEREGSDRSEIQSTSTTRMEETRQWCGVAILLRWEVVPNQNKVRSSVIRRHPENRVLFEHTETGSFETLVRNTESREQGERFLEEQTRPKLGSACAAAPATIAAGSPSNGTIAPGTLSSEERRRREADVASCRKDSDGKALDSATRLECNQERLTSIASFDEDDRKAKRDAQNQFNDIVNQIKKDLRKEVKTSLLSDEDSGDARSLVDDAIEAITEAGDEIGISRQIVQRAVSDIRNMYGAMSKGKELHDFQERAEQESIDMRARLDMARSQLDMANSSGDPWAMQHANLQMTAVLGQGMTMANVFNRTVDGRIAELRGYERMKWMEASDFTDFTAGIDQLRRDLDIYKSGGRMSSTTLPTSLSMPENFLQYRGDHADRYRSVYGNMPVRPSISTSVNGNGAPTNVQIPRATFNTYDPRAVPTRL